MSKYHYLINRFLKVIFVFLIIISISCKTQKQNIKPDSDNTNNSEQIKPPQPKEPLPGNVNPDLLEEQKVNDFAEKKSGLLCSLNQLKREFDNTNNAGRKMQIGEQINQLKGQIAELDKEIENTFQDIERINDVSRIAESLSQDC